MDRTESLGRDRAFARSMVLFAATLTFSLVVLEVTIVNVALGEIRKSLGADLSDLQWVSNAYMLVFASLLLTGGSVGDRIGLKPVFLAGMGVFTAFSVVCALAESVPVLLVGRIGQGVGAAMAIPVSLALIGAAFPERAARARAVSIWAGGASISLAVGMVAGGVLAEQFGWASIFWINVPLGAVTLAITLAYAPRAETRAKRPIDVPGQLLAIVSLASLTVGFVEAGPRGFGDPGVLAAFAAAFAAAGAFLVVEARSPHAMLPLSLVSRPGIGVGCFVGFVLNFSYYGLMFYVALYFQLVEAYTPATTGMAFLPMTAATILGNMVGGVLTARYGPLLPMTVGQGFGAFGCLAVATVIGTDVPYALLAVPLVCVSLSVAVTVPAMTVLVLSGVGGNEAGVASGALNAARQVGGVVGVGVFGAFSGGEATTLAGMLWFAVAAVGVAFLIGASSALAAARMAR